VDEKYLAEAVRTGKTARGKAKAALPSSDAESTEVYKMTHSESRFGFLRPVFAGILTVVAAGGAAAWLFIGLPKLRQNPGGNTGESSAAVTLPDLSAVGIDTSRFVRAEEPYIGGETLGFYLTDVQTDSAYEWCYDSPRPCEAWVRFDAENGDRIILDGQSRLRRYRRAVRASESTKPGLDAAVEKANAFAQTVIVGTVPEISVGEDDKPDHRYSACFASDEIWGFGDMDAEGNVVEWYTDYANMDGRTADEAAFDSAAAPLLDSLAAGQLEGGEKWQIVKRKFISMNGKVYGLYDVLMGRAAAGSPEEMPAYDTYYYMIDLDGKVSQPADLSALGIDTASYQKTAAPYAYDIHDLYNLNGDTQMPAKYTWNYSYYPYAPHEVWDEYRGANGEQLVFDQQGNFRRFRSSAEMPQSEAPLSEQDLKVRGAELVQAIVPGVDCNLTGGWFEGAYHVDWDAADASAYRCGTVFMNSSGDIWYILNDCYALQSVADTGKYDEAARRLYEHERGSGSAEITDRFFIAFGGKVYGCYTFTEQESDVYRMIVDANESAASSSIKTGVLLGELDLSQYVKADTPVIYTIETALTEEERGMITYEWNYAAAIPSEEWDEYRGPNGEQILFDTNGTLRSVWISDTCPAETEILDSQALKARAEEIAHELVPSEALTVTDGEWINDAYHFAFWNNSSDVLLNGTIVLNRSGKLWNLNNNRYVWKNPENRSDYDNAALEMSKSLAPGGQREIISRKFMEFSGKIYGYYLVKITNNGETGEHRLIIDVKDRATTDTDLLKAIPEGTTLPDLTKYDLSAYGIDTASLRAEEYLIDDYNSDDQLYEWFGSGKQPHRKWIQWFSEDSTTSAVTDELGRIRLISNYREGDNENAAGFEKRADEVFRLLNPAYDGEAMMNDNTSKTYSALKQYQEYADDLYLAQFRQDGTLSFLQIDYCDADENTDLSFFDTKLQEYQEKLRTASGLENAEFSDVAWSVKRIEGRLCIFYDFSAVIPGESEIRQFRMMTAED
jgi:hypothetical protein